MNSDDAFQELKEKLEGKTIQRIEQAESRGEGICKFVLSDNSSFDLCATDLGFWIEGRKGGDGLYRSLADLVEAVYDYRYSSGYVETDPAILIDNELIIVDAYDGKLFIMAITNLTDEEKKFTTSDLQIKKMSAMMACGMVPNENAKWLDGIE